MCEPENYTKIQYHNQYYGFERQLDNSGAEIQGTHNAVNNIYLNGTRIAAATSTGQKRYFLSDQVDSVHVVMDETGAAISRSEYLPYGEAWVQTGDKGYSPKYNGQELDGESDFYYYNARHYDPQIGRFISADTVVDGATTSAGWNRYMYVHGNPVMYKDPSGHGLLEGMIEAFSGGSSEQADQYLGIGKETQGDKENNVAKENTEANLQKASGTGNEKLISPVKPGNNAVISSHHEQTITVKGATYKHQGTDIAANRGTEVVAAKSGKIDTSGNDDKPTYGANNRCKTNCGGKTITIITSEGEKIQTMHHDDVYVEKNQKVKQGDPIGTIGLTGNTTGPHTHVQIIDKNGSLKNFEKEFQKDQGKSLDNYLKDKK